MAGAVPMIIVVAVGAGALGGPEALRLLLTFAGRSPSVDIGIAVFVMAAVTAPALGIMLLARFFRETPSTVGRGSARGAAATDSFAKVTLMVSVAVVFPVTACLVVEQLVEAGGFGPFPLVAVALAVVVVAGAVPGPVRDIVHLSRFFRSVSGAAPAHASATPATTRFANKTMLASFATVCLLLVPYVAAGGLDAPGLLFAFAGQSPPVHTNVLVGFATVVVTALLALLSHKARNAAAPPPATVRFPNMILVMITTLAVVLFLAACLLAIPWTNRACSA